MILNNFYKNVRTNLSSMLEKIEDKYEKDEPINPSGDDHDIEGNLKKLNLINNNKSLNFKSILLCNLNEKGKKIMLRDLLLNFIPVNDPYPFYPYRIFAKILYFKKHLNNDDLENIKKTKLDYDLKFDSENEINTWLETYEEENTDVHGSSYLKDFLRTSGIAKEEEKKRRDLKFNEDFIEEYENNYLNLPLFSDTQINEIDFNINLNFENLYFPENQLETLKKQIKNNLKIGKNIILIGPPGTGKTKLAKSICDNYGVKYKITTANSDWSTYDTIGGYQLNKDNKLEFKEGLFLGCLKDKFNRVKNQWLILDEINRADIDKTFGALYSALTGDNVTLSFKANNEKNIFIKNSKNKIDEEIDKNEYLIHKDWRIIATMNTFDKASLYEMSYAFMRRFAFIQVEIPDNISEDIINKYIEIWENNDQESTDKYRESLIKLWKEVNKVREIGPAIIKDIYSYIKLNNGDFTSPIIMYILPQFEAVRKSKIDGFIDKISDLGIVNNKDELKNLIYKFFDFGSYE